MTIYRGFQTKILYTSKSRFSVDVHIRLIHSVNRTDRIGRTYQSFFLFCKYLKFSGGCRYVLDITVLFRSEVSCKLNYFHSDKCQCENGKYKKEYFLT